MARTTRHPVAARGIAPAKILCITFTKGRRSNMANRVFKTLRRMDSLLNDSNTC